MKYFASDQFDSDSKVHVFELKIDESDEYFNLSWFHVEFYTT